MSQVTEEEKTRAQFTGGSAHYAGSTQKWTELRAALQPLSGPTLEDSNEGKSSQWAELQAIHVVELFGRRNSQMCYYSLIHGL